MISSMCFINAIIKTMIKERECQLRTKPTRILANCILPLDMLEVTCRIIKSYCASNAETNENKNVIARLTKILSRIMEAGSHGGIPFTAFNCSSISFNCTEMPKRRGVHFETRLKTCSEACSLHFDVFLLCFWGSSLG